MRRRTIAVAFASAAAVTSAAIGASVATLLAETSAARVDKSYAALVKVAFTMPRPDALGRARPTGAGAGPH